MNVFKQLNASDTVTTPFVVNKAFAFSGSNNFTASNVGIDVFVGTLPTESLFKSGSAPTTGYISTQYRDLIYSSIRQLYYSNYYSQSYGDNVGTASIIPNDFYISSSVDTVEGVVESGVPDEDFPFEDGNYRFNITGPGRTTNYYNYLSNTLTASRDLRPATTGIGVVSIPSNLYGEYIKPGSFKSTVRTGSFSFVCTDDGLGNIFTNDNSGRKQAGNIIYEHGLIIYTLNRFTTGSGFSPTTFSPSAYVLRDDLEIEFSSSITLYETQFNCRLREGEYNFTTNPSIISGSASGSLYPYATGSFFKPYITTVGLYNESYDLIAVGKLSQPLPKSNVVDTNIIINLDMY